MQEEKLEQIRRSIRENWGQVEPFKIIPKGRFNCYMFAICNTEPTEILTENGNYISIIDENVAYFGSIGKISRTSYKTLEQYKQAFINDLRVLGISAEEYLEDITTTGDTIKVAFFSNFEEGISEEDEEFHFLRFVSQKNQWMGKEGFPGGFQELGYGCPIEQIRVINQKRIGIFKLALI